MTEPLHIRKKWQNVACRLQHEARKNDGYAILRTYILIDPNGDPVSEKAFWIVPELLKFEPKGESNEFAVMLQAMGLI